MVNKKYLIAVRIKGQEEQIYSFSNLEDRDAFLKELKKEVGIFEYAFSEIDANSL